jgi:hypothetical protein
MSTEITQFENLRPCAVSSRLNRSLARWLEARVLLSIWQAAGSGTARR